MISKISIIIGISIMVIYLLPLFKSKLNIGNVFGITVGALLLVYGVLYDIIYSYRILGVIANAFVTVFVVFMLIFCITFSIIVFNSKTDATNEKTVIVLGCRVKGVKPSRALNERCMVAIKYLKSNDNAIAILSGGQGKDENISEARCMAEIFQKNGISKDKFIIEEKSTSTEENLLFSKEIIDKLGLSYDIAIATNEYHLYRSKLLAKDLGFNAKGISSKSLPVLRITYFTREVFGLYYRIIKRAKN